MDGISLGLLRRGVAAYLVECLHEARSQIVELAGVVAGKAFEDLATLARDAEDGAAAIAWIGRALEQAFALGAVHQFDNAVVFELEAGSGVGDGDGGFRGCAGYLEKQLMLLGLQASEECRRFAEMKEAAKLKAEVGEGAKEQGGLGVEVSGHRYIVSRYIYPHKSGPDESSVTKVAA